MKLVVILLGIFLFGFCFGDVNERDRFPRPVWIYFKDKGLSTLSPLERLQLDEKVKQRTFLAQERRMRVSRSSEYVIDDYDFPVNEEYIKSVESMSHSKIRKSSKWLNAVSIVMNDFEIYNEIGKLSFVSKIDDLKSYKRMYERVLDGEKEKQQTLVKQVLDGELNYGDSYDQLQVIEVPNLHSMGYTGFGVTIAVLDSGFNLNHPAIKDLDIYLQHDFVNDDDDVMDQPVDEIEGNDPENHGTATLSTLGGKDDGEHYGPAFGATFLLAKTESVEIEDPVEEDYFISAVEWAEENGMDILSSSLGYQDWYSYDDKTGTALIDTTLDIAVEEKGVTVFLSVGNEHKYNLGPTVPGDSIRALSIGAVYLNGDITSFSSQGPTFDGRYKPELCAPGQNIHVANYAFAVDNENYVHKSGTSFSAPLVAGAAALLLEAHPDWRPIDLHSALMTTASQSNSPDNIKGWGLINATAAYYYEIPEDKQHDNGNCDDFSDCSCSPNYYGPYCQIPYVHCDEYCTGGYCDDEDCHCDTKWEGKLCIGECEILEGGCLDCLSYDCGYCGITKSCITREYSDTCEEGYSETHCETLVQANDKETNVDAYFVLAVVILCFALLLFASAVAFFFCIIRP